MLNGSAIPLHWRPSDRVPSDLAKEHEAVGACVLVDNGKEFYCLDVEEGWVTTGIGKRI